MTSYRKYFLDFKEFPSPKPVYVGKNNAIMAYGQGTINVDMKVNGKWVSNHLSEVWYVPDVSRNLFSVSQTLAKGFVFQAEGNECSFTRDGHGRIRTANSLYALKMCVVCPEVPAKYVLLLLINPFNCAMRDYVIRTKLRLKSSFIKGELRSVKSRSLVKAACIGNSSMGDFMKDLVIK
ncbi:hypothetical protein AVEN_75526-1 [Araneus ventricosus]|uniref:Retrovirus-related Pol polyprotein from transposon TNT 1-94-like beta-barrel domain-containing protein n=1 Tax=Araneus ventricosus TaxID=182803 RepID=A0A4Y2DQM1_ARAVE|nr:hypothetical protein AVEN_75526-1 [Araneus ventricosus]